MQILPLSKIENSRVFLRIDFDVPIVNGVVQDTYRLKKNCETVKYLLGKRNKIVLFTKIGRPEKKSEELSTKNLINELTKILQVENIHFEEKLENLNKLEGELTLFENTRFYDFEYNLDENTKKIIKDNFDIYVDEAFAMSHREESTNYDVPKLLEKGSVGLNYAQEIKTLNKIKKGNFFHPSLFILGGVKAETKIPMIEKLVNKFSYFLLGGKLVTDKDLIALKTKYKNIKLLTLNESTLDIDAKSLDVLTRSVLLAKTIIWNGPLGKFEDEAGQYATKALIQSLKDFRGLKIAGGGDTLAAIEKFGHEEDFDFLSTGGGAMFSFLSGEKTNIEKLMKY
ncbi:phosphoglycerate kinase [Patescibacteria group bacterium]|nr:phosphoglycerate kinase [Patescibacteria group bacterium]